MRCVLLLSAIVFLGIAQAAAQTRPVQVTASFGDRLGPLEIDRMALGQGGQSPEPMWDGRIVEIRALRPRIIRLFIQEYFNLMPEPGRYHFDSLDRSVATILAAGAEPLMCLCFKPKAIFPEINQDVVEPADYAAWERLIEALVSHYRGERWHRVRYWEVANEPDIGESGGCPYRFQPESYARYYRHTAAAVRRADPQGQVGGPALASVRSPIFPALLAACEKEKLPLDFVSWHIYSSDPGQVRGTIDFAKGLLKKHPGLKPETVLDEWNMDLMNPPLDPRFQPCYLLEVIWQMKEAGLDWSCYYQIRDYQVDQDRFARFFSPQGAAFMARWWNRMPQFDGLFDYQNNVRPAYFAFKLLSRMAGDRLRLVSSDPAVHGFLTRDDKLQMWDLLLWNFSARPVEIDLTLDGLPQSMRIRHVVLDALAPSSDENARLRPDPSGQWKKGAQRVRVPIDAYGVHYWAME